MSFRYLFAIFVGVIGLSAFVLSGSPTASAQTAGGPSIGAYAQPVGGQNNIDAVVQLESTLGATLPMVRGFNQWDDAIGEDKPFHRFVRDGGRDLTISVKPKRSNGQRIQWSEIANAQPGSAIYNDIAQMADGLRRYGAPVIFNFHHEPETNPVSNYGTSDEFRAAFRNVHDIFDAQGATNVQHAVILTEWGFEVARVDPNDSRRAELWYPGDDVVDIIGSDEYNWNNCRGNGNDPWISLADDLAPFLAFADRHPGKQLMLGEFGSDAGSPGQKAQWLQDAQNWFKTSPEADRFVALLYFHDDGAADGFAGCNWWLDSSGASTAAAQAWFRDSAFGGRLNANTPAPNIDVQNSPHPPCETAASDPDGDGYGWENLQSCIVVR